MNSPLEGKNVKLTVYSKFGRAFSVDAKDEDLQNIDIVITEKAARMIYQDLEKVLKGKQ